jgi:hypothetical protein
MPRVRLLEVMPVRNALKAVGAALAVIALCGPLIFWPVDDAGTTPTELYQATVTVPPVAVVATTLAPGETTSTTKVAAEPTSTTTTTEPPISITIAAVGDILPHESILESVKEDDWYKFWPVFAPVAPYLRAADFTLATWRPGSPAPVRATVAIRRSTPPAFWPAFSGAPASTYLLRPTIILWTKAGKAW